MSTRRGSGADNGGVVQPIPVGSWKVVHSLKEIVNCPEAEIYATLKECNMDPNEAVNRLLSQGGLCFCSLYRMQDKVYIPGKCSSRSLVVEDKVPVSCREGPCSHLHHYSTGVLVYKFYGDEFWEMFGYEEQPYGFYTMAGQRLNRPNCTRLEVDDEYNDVNALLDGDEQEDALSKTIEDENIKDMSFRNQ